MERFAFFDFDGTLASGDSILPYLLWCVRKGYAPRLQVLKAFFGYIAQRMDPRKVCRSKELTLSFLKGKTQAEMDQIAELFWQEELTRRFFPEGISRLKELRDRGFHIIIVSASPSCYMKVLPAYIPVEDVICTACHLDQRHRFDGQVSYNCKGQEKVRLIKDWLKSHHFDADFSDSHAYGDSLSDVPMLSMTGHPVIVNPSEKLKHALPCAEIVSWKINKKNA